MPNPHKPPTLGNGQLAKADIYSWTEDQLLGLALFSAASNIASLDVTANDKKNTTLYSIDDGVNYASDLLSEDTLVGGLSAWQSAVSTTGTGDRIRIDNGSIDLDLSASIAALTGGSTDINALAAGDHIHDTFVYAVQQGNALSWTTVTVDIDGSNDAASISGTNTGSVTDVAGHTTAAGTLTASDIDHGESHFQTPASLAGAYGTFTFDAMTGEWTYTLDHDLASTLGDGEIAHETLTATSFDGTASSIIDVTVTGIVDVPPPVVLSIAQTDAPTVTEGSVVHYQVTFSETVTGVDASQFSLVSNGVSGAAITGVSEVSGSDGTEYIVSVSTGTGDGTLNIRVIGDAIQNSEGDQLVTDLFLPQTTYATGSGPLLNFLVMPPLDGTVTDVNGDGNPDILTGNYLSDTVSVLLGNGDGTFQSAASYATGARLNDLELADVNGDHITDLVTANFDGNSVSVLLGNGDGTFAPHVDYATEFGPYMVKVADLNGDDRPDLITPNDFSGSVSILLGNGDGTFATQTTYNSTGLNPWMVETGDFDEDGRSDVVVVNSSGSLGVLLGNGDGTFQPTVNYSVGHRPTTIAIADLNGDHHADLITPNNESHTASVLLGNGDGTFQPEATYATGINPLEVAVADFNGDAVPDMAITNFFSNDVSILIGNGDGTFQPQLSYVVGIPFTTPGARPVGILTSDVDNDGIIDLIVGNTADNNLAVLLGNGDGTFQPFESFATGANPYQFALTDVNSDGLRDAITGNIDSANVSVLLHNVLAGTPYTIEHANADPVIDPNPPTDWDVETATGHDIQNVSLYQPRDINNVGEIVGNDSASSGFLYDIDTASKLVLHNPTVAVTQAIGANDVGQIVGYLYDGGSFNHAFLYDVDTATYTVVDKPGSFGSNANGINNAGTIVGAYADGTGTHGYIDIGGVFTTLDHADGVNGTILNGINDSGQIVGIYFDASHVTHGFLYDGGAFTNLDVSAATGGTFANGINNAGEVSGYYVDGSGHHTFLYDSGSYTTIDNPASGTGQTNAWGNNDAGDFVGDGGGGTGFIATTTTESDVVTANDIVPDNASLSLLTTDGTLSFSDTDLADAHIASVNGVAGNHGTLHATVTTDTTGTGTGGVISWDYEVAESEVAALSAPVVDTFEVGIDDGHGGTVTQEVTIGLLPPGWHVV